MPSELGANEDAYRSCELARHLLLAEGDRVSLGDATEGLGRAAHRLGRLDSAAEYYRHAIELFREYGDKRSQAHVLHRLDNAYDAAGRPDDALDVWTQAAELLTELEHPDADAVRAKAARTVSGEGGRHRDTAASTRNRGHRRVEEPLAGGAAGTV